MKNGHIDTRERLLQRRRELTRLQVAHVEEEHALAAAEETDWSEHAALHAGNDALHRLSARDRYELGEIDAALARLTEGRYGVCESCDLPIDPERLRALPEARRCIACEMDGSYAAHAQRYIRPERAYDTAHPRPRRRGRA